MESSSYLSLSIRLLLLMLATMAIGQDDSLMAADKPRVIVTSDGEIDDECSMVRFLLYANEFDIEGIITSSSQYHCSRAQLGRRRLGPALFGGVCQSLSEPGQARPALSRLLIFFSLERCLET